MEDKKDRKDPFDGEYIGNIWGWRNTFIGLGLILFLLGVMIYRHIAMDVPFGDHQPIEEVEMQDTLLQKD